MGRPLDLSVRPDLYSLHSALELLPVEVYVAQVQDRSQDLEDCLALLVGKA
jgi:hypothetical protein